MTEYTMYRCVGCGVEDSQDENSEQYPNFTLTINECEKCNEYYCNFCFNNYHKKDEGICPSCEHKIKKSDKKCPTCKVIL